MIEQTPSIIVGAGAGLSTSAGLTYSGERFEKYFGDFAAKYSFSDMYTGGFYPYQMLEEKWAYWSRYIYINRYQRAPLPVYEQLLDVIKDKDYFVITTNVDHQFQLAGFDKQRLFYTQGDYGLWQCSTGEHKQTIDNEEVVRDMVLAQGFEFGKQGELIIPESSSIQGVIPTELIPYCPVCGEPMKMNLRSDYTFVQDDGWDKAAQRYSTFLQHHETGLVLYLELGIGANTPVIIKFPFWKRVRDNPEATYACLNQGEAYVPVELAHQSILLDGDIGTILNQLQG